MEKTQAMVAALTKQAPNPASLVAMVDVWCGVEIVETSSAFSVLLELESIVGLHRQIIVAEQAPSFLIFSHMGEIASAMSDSTRDAIAILDVPFSDMASATFFAGEICRQPLSLRVLT